MLVPWIHYLGDRSSVEASDEPSAGAIASQAPKVPPVGS